MKYLVTFTCLVLACCLFCSFMPNAADHVIYDNTIRLHVLANSDSEHDQSVKLAVRDAVLSEMETLLACAENPDDAVTVLSENLDRIRELCNETLVSLGENLTATVILSEEKYPTRNYEAMSLPAGVYKSLRIKIGAAEGQNWWCVLYPALCTNVAKRRNPSSKQALRRIRLRFSRTAKARNIRSNLKFLRFSEKRFPDKFEKIALSYAGAAQRKGGEPHVLRNHKIGTEAGQHRCDSVRNRAPKKLSSLAGVAKCGVRCF